MGTRMPILRRLSAVLSSAFLEWILMLLLFIDAIYCFFVTKFARLCKLPTPCPFCSRLDHVLGNEKPCFYRDLICKTHKSEISSLAFCRIHQKLADAPSMCQGCSSSFAIKEKSSTDDNTGELTMDLSSSAIDSVNVLNNSHGNDAASHSPLKKICSCCAQHFKSRSITLFHKKIAAGVDPAEADISSRSSTEPAILHQVSKSLEPKDIYHSSDHISHDGYSECKMTSDSEVEVPCTDDGNRNSPPHGANEINEDRHEETTVEKLITPAPELEPPELSVEKELHVSESLDISSLASPVNDDHLHNELGGSQMEVKDSPPSEQASQDAHLVAPEDSDLKDNSEDSHVSQIPITSTGELSQDLCAVEECPKTSEPPGDPSTSELASQQPHHAVLEDSNTKENLKGAHGPEITITSSGELYQRSGVTDYPSTSEPAPQDTNHVVLENTNTKDNLGEAHGPQVGIDSSGVVEDCTKIRKATGDLSTYEPISRDPYDVVSEDLITKDNLEEAHVSQVAISSTGKISQALGAVEECPKTSENTGEPRPSLSTQISMTEAYKLATGSKSSLPSPTLTDVIIGKDSSSVNEELRLLISQLSAARGLEAPWVDPGPSPRAYAYGDDLVVQNITKRISIERNASGLESLDTSIISEIEGESTIDRLRRQIELDRKSINLLCKELEEERNASAIAASQALAMITRLQDEKAAMQMEALHYQRMMEEQAEYDNEALEKSSELLAQREQQIQELEAELQSYRRQFVGERKAEKQAEQIVAFEGENNATTACRDEALEVPPNTAPISTNSLVGFEDEKAYITTCLRKLEQKLHLYSNNSTSVYLSNSDSKEDEIPKEMSFTEDRVSRNHQHYVSVESVENDSSPPQEISNAAQESLLSAKEAQFSAMSREGDISKIQEEILDLNQRLKTLEADHNFLEHSANSLRNGNEGLQFIQEIALNLRELRAIGIERK